MEMEYNILQYSWHLDYFAKQSLKICGCLSETSQRKEKIMKQGGLQIQRSA